MTTQMRRVFGISVLAFIFALTALRATAAEPIVNVILWFDTEDYLLPADDDATLRLAQMLTKRGVRATFKLVGEKARVLEKRGRTDVIAALKKHEIGYHANYHSVHPTPTEYLADCGLLDGIAEFVRREGGGAADVRRILNVSTLACYGQPGSSWGPQTLAGLAAIGVAPHGVPCYVDEGSHVGLNSQPFWYAGALNVYHMGNNYTRMELHDASAVEPGKKKVTEIAERLARESGGGVVSIFYHPCEWVHKTFWDGVNFSRGANPPREQWKAPPQLPPEETEAAFDRFAQYIDHIRGIKGVRWITAADLPEIYPDRVRVAGATQAELDQMAAAITATDSAGLDFRVIGNKSFSAAHQFELLSKASLSYVQGKAPTFPVYATGLLGPDANPPASQLKEIAPLAFRDTLIDVVDSIEKNKRVPARVFIGPDPVAPADFLFAIAKVYQRCRAAGSWTAKDSVELGHGIKILSERKIAQDTPGLFGGWVIHREGFRAPKVMEIARLQAWTLMPGVP